MRRSWPHLGAFVVCLITACALVPWRPDALYSGGADPVVVAKAALTTTALFLALAVARARGRTRAVPAAPLLWVSALLATTVTGAAFDGRAEATVVLASGGVLVVLEVRGDDVVQRTGPAARAVRSAARAASGDHVIVEDPDGTARLVRFSPR